MLLVQQALSGNQLAFERIVKQFEPAVARTTMGMLNNLADAEDVAQETFIRFYHSMKQYKGEAALGTYLTRIAINLSLNALKKRSKRRWLPFDNKTDGLMADEDHLKGKEDKEVVDWALKKLDSDFRSVIVVRLIQGYSTKETAEILGIPQGTVLSRLSRAQQKLKELLKPTLNSHENH
jgi:RNA polymerase sigma-70 factor (ECF subfamily)